MVQSTVSKPLFRESSKVTVIDFSQSMFGVLWEYYVQFGGLIHCNLSGRVKLGSGIRFSESVICEEMAQEE